MLYLHFATTFTSNQSLEELARAHQELDPFLSGPEEYLGELRRHVIAESVHFSTKIEGNTLTLDQVESLLRGEQVSAAPDQIQEAENYWEAMEYARSVATSRRPHLSEDTIKAIHFIVSKSLPGEYGPGRYREAQNAVVDRVTKRRIFYPPPVDKVEELMGEFARWVNSPHEGVHPYYRAALAHLNFVAIHPFIDGNGRTARIIETLVLYLSGYKAQDLVSLEAYFASDTQGYYQALAKALGTQYRPEGADVTNWVEYHLHAHSEQAKRAVADFRLIDLQWDALSDAFAKELGPGPGQITGLWLACERGFITNSAYRDFAKVGNQTAVKYLARLVEAGLLVREGSGRGTRYVPADQTYAVYQSAEVALAMEEAGE